MIKYSIMSLKETVDDGCVDAEDYYDPEFTMGVFELDDDGHPIKLLGTDGGEPEDQTLYRDWSWIATALNKAFQNGYEKGLHERSE
jgi:hypothetical protein